ncbi:MAG: prepilin peptidase [Butyrivibrio sp.]|nr:prepilin peptidase [Butyrivibrio sp.]
MLFWIIIMILMFVAATEDLFTKEISLLLPASCGAVSIVYVASQIIRGEGGILEAIASLIPGLIFVFLAFATRESIGYGDGLMMLGFSPVLGFEKTCFCIVVALTLSSILSLFILVLGKGNRNTRISFVPMLAIGVGVTFLAQV